MFFNNLMQAPCILKTKNRIVHLQRPIVMGILNVTPDSFYDGGYYNHLDMAIEQASKMLTDGATIIDIGGQSTRPNAEDIGFELELARVLPVIKAVKNAFPYAIISIDTFRSEVAHEAIQSGADIINDISAGDLDAEMFKTVARLQVPYIMMHMQGTPRTMQENPYYSDVVTEVFDYLFKKVQRLQAMGAYDLIIDPGFGFGKTVAHNFALLKHLNVFTTMGLPVLAGLSRKSMINRVLGTKPENALNGTTALNTVALLNGAHILRVHDVKEAVQTIKLVSQL